jgi:hypothetical protein
MRLNGTRSLRFLNNPKNVGFGNPGLTRTVADDLSRRQGVFKMAVAQNFQVLPDIAGCTATRPVFLGLII